MANVYTGIRGFHTLQICEWCGNEYKGRREHCCSKDCNDKYWQRVKENRMKANARPGMFWNEIKREVFTRDAYTCQKCKTTVRYVNCQENMECHHITPIVLGGTNELNNLITLCHDCHLKEHPKGYVKQAKRMRENKPLL